MEEKRIAVLGAGSWGTTLADLLARKGMGVNLWARSEELCREIGARRENSVYLPGVRLSGGLTTTPSLEDALLSAGIVVTAIPSHGLRAVLAEAAPFIRRDAIIVSATKGIEAVTSLTPSGIITDALSGAGFAGPVVVLSGPSFAREVSLGLPAAVVSASRDIAAAGEVQRVFSSNHFRVYTNTDVAGVELGGALKNVMAIASGISDGLKLGNNSRAALITRGLAEMARLGVRLGASASTFAGLSGMGDLVLTCTGPLSRNYSVGVELGKGRKIADITAGMRMVAEGIKTSSAAKELSIREDVGMPIAGAVHEVVHKGKDPMEAVTELMERGLKGELD